MGKLGSCLGAQRAQGPHYNSCMLCTTWFLMFKHWFCWKYQYNKCMFNFIYIYSFTPVSGCAGMGPRAPLCPGAYNAVKTVLYTSDTSRENTTTEANGNLVSGWRHVYKYCRLNYLMGFQLSSSWYLDLYQQNRYKTKGSVGWACVICHSVLKKLYTEPSIGASYQVSIHSAKRFQRRLKCEKLTDDKLWQKLTLPRRAIKKRGGWLVHLCILRIKYLGL